MIIMIDLSLFATVFFIGFGLGAWITLMFIFSVGISYLIHRQDTIDL